MRSESNSYDAALSVGFMMAFQLEMLPAGDGDCLVLTWGSEGRMHHAVIDGGRQSAFEPLRTRLSQIAAAGGTFELLVLSHVDADHIEGLLVRGLSNADAARLVAARENTPFASVDDLWRRARVPHAALTELAEADAFRPSIGLSRRDALWAIKAFRDEPLPLFAAAADREATTVSEQAEPVVRLRAMPEGGEVVEDYGHVGLTLRQHPVSFLRAELGRRRHITCAEAMSSRDRRWVEVAGLVLVRQRPGSAKGVMFITIEDETGVANLVVWTKVFEANRRTVLGAGMMGVRGRIQREGEVVHLVAHALTDLSREFASVGRRGRTGEEDTGPAIPSGRMTHRMPPAKVMSDPYGRVVDEIRVKTRDFR